MPTIIDTHCHIGLHKYEPLEVLRFHMARSGVDQAVFIQYMGNVDNQYLLDAMTAYPGQFAAAMLVDADDDGSQVRAWAERGINGIRLPANFRGTGSDPLAHWRTAAQLDLVVSAPSTPQSLLGEAFAEILQRFPNLQIVIEHLGGVKPGMDETTFRPIQRLAQHENLTIKVPGFGEFCNLPYPFQNVPPFADWVLEAFGPQRMMWGSDWPPVSSREGYDSSLRFPQRHFAHLSEDERAWIFGKTAQKIWGLGTGDW
ncbi:MAG: amidohydrolase [Caldilineaceae bacterium]|nr:amidohydrolase [Caldilineaceae bacterium]